MAESTTLNGHVCARLKTIDGLAVNSTSWVSLQVYPQYKLFEPMDGGGCPCGRKNYYLCCGKTCCRYEAAVATAVGVPVTLLGLYMGCLCLGDMCSTCQAAKDCKDMCGICDMCLHCSLGS